MLGTYSKTSSASGMDRLIPHSLDGFTADLLVQDLSLARPFAEFIIGECFPEDLERLSLYQSHLFVNTNKLFTTTDISTVMARYTLKHMQVNITVRDWRQISIAFRRKLCPGQIAITEEHFGEDHISAEQTGHSVRTERLKYAISAEALLGPSEDILPLFLEASGEWQQVMRVVPGMRSTQSTALLLTVV